MLILHDYPESFFAEKVRRILAWKGVPWRQVEQPKIMPKPDLVALTGGYRRVPVLQVGAEVYCDTARIARALDEIVPEPACIPPQQRALCALLEDWGDRRLVPQVVAPVIVSIMPMLPPGFLEDRASMSPGLGERVWRATAPSGRRQAVFSFDRLDDMLRERPFLLGDAFTLADAACFHPVWFARQDPALAEAISERRALAAWFARIEAFGPGQVRAMTPAEALAIAREAAPADGDGPEVAVYADDYGTEATRGRLVRRTDDAITLRRTDPIVGDVAVHFPRAGYRIEKV
ncbi:MAG: glutathione S-transferase family protein [bacterium]|nr:glutathione S-transferase family protein [bacterium]